MALMVEKAVFLLMMMMTALHVIDAAVYKVGDSAGWTIMGNVDYKKWASTKNFKIGDTIIFEYNANFHNVMRVTHAMYKSCNGSSPLTTFMSGNDSIKIKNYGHHLFLCGAPGHCQAGQKVDINVLKVSSSNSSSAAAPAPSPAQTYKSPSAVASPVPVANTPAPSTSKSSPFIVVKGSALALIMGVLVAAFSVSTYA